MVLGSLAIVLVGLYAGVLVVLVVARLTYPFELDFIEGGLLVQAWRMARGLPVWLPPNLEFVPHGYTPLFTILGAIPIHFTGPVLWPLRLISVMAMVATTIMLHMIARRQANLRLGLLCVGLYLAGYDIVGGWYDLARVDSLFMALTLGGMALAATVSSTTTFVAPVHSTAQWRDARPEMAALLLVLAFFTKQTALGFALAVGGWLLVACGWRNGARFGATYTVGLAAGVVVLNWVSHGAFQSTVLMPAASEPIEVPRLASFVLHEVVGRMGPLMFLLAYTAWQSRRAPNAVTWLRSNPWLVFTGVALVLSALQRGRPGGALNSLMPLYTLLCLAPALAWKAHRDQPGQVKRLAPHIVQGTLLVLVVAQLALARYDPRQHYPTPEMYAAGERLLARVANAGGPVWVLNQPTFNLLAGQEPSVQLIALYHARDRGQAPFPADLIAAVESQSFALILASDSLFDQEPAFLKLLQGHYAEVETLPPSEAPATLNGMPVRSYRRLLPF